MPSRSRFPPRCASRGHQSSSYGCTSRAGPDRRTGRRPPHSDRRDGKHGADRDDVTPLNAARAAPSRARPTATSAAAGRIRRGRTRRDRRPATPSRPRRAGRGEDPVRTGAPTALGRSRVGPCAGRHRAGGCHALTSGRSPRRLSSSAARGRPMRVDHCRPRRVPPRVGRRSGARVSTSGWVACASPARGTGGRGPRAKGATRHWPRPDRRPTVVPRSPRSRRPKIGRLVGSGAAAGQSWRPTRPGGACSCTRWPSGSPTGTASS